MSFDTARMLDFGCRDVLRWISVLVYLSSFSNGKHHGFRCRTKSDNMFHGTMVDCSSEGLHEMDIPILDIPVNNTTTLLLDYNSFQYIKNGSFARLQKLLRLQIDGCGISHLEVNAFEGLAELQILSLRYNSLDITDGDIPFGLFANIPLIKNLNIANNPVKADFGNYSNFIDIFYSLPELRSLYITSFPTLYIGKEFEKLCKLELLYVCGSSVSLILNNSLEGLEHSNLKHFKLFFANPYEFQTGVFSSLPRSIRSLTLYGVSVGNRKVLKAMEPLQGRTIHDLYLDHISLSDKIDPKLQIVDGIVEAKDVEFLMKICVFELTWKNSLLMSINLGHASNSTLWSCLTKINLSGNKLQHYEIGFFVDFLSMQVLEEVRISSDGLPKHTENFWDESDENLLETISIDNHHRSPSLSRSPPQQSNNYYAWLPAHLRYISIDLGLALRDHDPNIRFGNPNNLTELLNRYSRTAMAINFLLLGLNNLRLLDFTGSVIEQIPLSFFDFFPNLQILVLSQTQKNPDFLQIYGSRLIYNIANLVYLDLSNNGLNMLPEGMFQENRFLRYLCLAKNRFSTIPFQIRLVPSLEKLDLRWNAISSLDKNEQMNIDDHISKSRAKNFTLLMEGNNLQCICTDLTFAVWMLRRNAHLNSNDRLTCTGEDSKSVTIESSLNSEQMWRTCYGHDYLMLSILLLFAMLFLYVAVFVVSMYRTFIIGKLKQMFVPEFQRQTRQDFTYDVFICYANQECLFVRSRLLRYLEGVLKLKTFVHQRDLRQDLLEWGTALKDSWRTLLVITDAFLTNDMSEYIMKTATFFESPSKQDSIIVMVTQDLLYAIPDYVLRVVKDENIIVLPDLETPFSYEVTETLRTRILY